MQQVFYANGKLWAALDTGVLVNGSPQAGVAFFVLQPKGSPNIPSASVVTQGVTGLLGIALAVAATKALLSMGARFMPPTLLAGIALDWRVLAFAIAAALLTGFLFGLVPAVRYGYGR